MSKRAPQTAGAVSLFPFLAVLICAMGALILLLLVTTRRIRHQQSHAATEVVAPSPAPEPLPKPPMLVEPAAPLSPPPPEYALSPLDPLFALDPVPELPDPNEPWRERLQSLDVERAQLAAAVSVQESEVESVRTLTAALSQQIEELHEQSAALMQDKEQLEQRFARLRQDERDTDARAAYLRRKIDETRAQLASADSKYAILPFDGRLGTTRRPIILECTEDAITFVSEGVTLRARDLDGFTSLYNPLLMASQALSKYWARKDRREVAGTDGEPYLLLVVRPQGTVAYYAARKLLGPAHENFGYELVCEDQEFVWPESDPVATHLCREIVDRMLAERDALFATMSETAREHAREFSSADGAFQLEEVERARNPGRGVALNGVRFSRLPVGTIGPERPAPWGQPDAATATTFVPPGGQAAPRPLQLAEPAFPIGGESVSDAAADDPALSALRPARPERPAQPLGNPQLTKDERSEPAPATRSPFAEFLRESGEDGSASGSVGAASPGSQGELSSSEVGSGDAAPRQRERAQSDSEETLDLVPFSRRDVPRGADGDSPQWGIRRPGGLIGFEREVLVRVTADRITVADETAFAISPGMPADELRRLFAAHLNHQVHSWGEPPRSFYWLPTVNFMVSPGGIQFYERLKAATTEHWKLRSTVKHVLE